MSAVDVPVALLGYGTVGAAVHRLLTESADDIERATGHRLRVVRALVRDPAKERAFTPERRDPHNRRRLTYSATDSIPIVAEVMGGLEPTGDYVIELSEVGETCCHGQQTADRASLRRAVRGCLRRQCAAAVRGLGLCAAIPCHQRSARIARRLPRTPLARNRQRYDQLHPHRGWKQGADYDGSARRGEGARLRRG